MNKIDAITEISQKNFHQVRTSVFSFIQNNKWFKGKLYLIGHKNFIFSQVEVNQLAMIYQDIQVINCSSILEVNSNNCLDIDLQKLMRIKRSFPQITNSRLLYFSNICLFRKEPEFLEDTQYTVKGNNLFFIESDQLLETKELKPGYSAEFASNFNDSFFIKNKKSLNTLNVVIFDTFYLKNINPLNTKINSIWLQENNITQLFLKNPKSFKISPSFVPINTNHTSKIKSSKKLNTSQISNVSSINYLTSPPTPTIRRKTEIITKYHELGAWNPSLYDRQSIAGLKVTITTMIWKRHAIFKLWAQSILRLIDEFKEVKIDVVVAGSEGNLSKELVEQYGFEYLEVPNRPLGAKSNARLHAAKKYNADYVLLTGSDDLFSNNLFLLILCNMAKGYDEIAPLDIYYYDTISKKSTYSHGYQGKLEGSPIAPGRALSRDLMDRVNWKLWSESENDYLDNWIKTKVNSLKKNHFYYSIRENGVVLCDIKSEVNMTEFKVRFNHEIVEFECLLDEIPELKKFKDI